eukprot:scaffold61301_cov45-Attheya_sp.AAC.6
MASSRLELVELSHDLFTRLKTQHAPPIDEDVVLWLGCNAFGVVAEAFPTTTTTRLRTNNNSNHETHDEIIRVHPMVRTVLSELSSHSPPPMDSLAHTDADAGTDADTVTDTGLVRVEVMGSVEKEIRRDQGDYAQTTSASSVYAKTLPLHEQAASTSIPVTTVSSITVDCISCTNEKLRTSLDNNRSNNLIMKQALEGRVVAIDSLVVAELLDDCQGNDDFLVLWVSQLRLSNGTQIHQEQQQQTPIITNTKCAYRLGSADTFDLHVVGVPPPRPNASTGFHILDKDISSPGYESFLHELYQLTSIPSRGTSSLAAPSALLVTGGVGVGKTRLRLMKEGVVQQVHRVSGNDIALAASASIDHNQLVQMLIPPSTTLPSQDGHGGGGTMVILDQLEDLCDDGDDQGNQNDSERVAAWNAIATALDQLVFSSSSSNNNNPVVIVGIVSGDPSTLLPPELVRVGRLEVCRNMTPPTEWQRRVMWNHLLWQQLPIANGNKVLLERWAAALASRTSGCVAADLRRICADAITRASSRVTSIFPSQIGDDSDSTPPLKDAHDNSALCIPVEPLYPPLSVTWDDLREAARNCVPTQLSQMDVTLSHPMDAEEELELPSTTNFTQLHEMSWRRFGGYPLVKKRIYRTVVRPWRQLVQSFSMPEEDATTKSWSIPPPSGVLFHGPSGCGKSLAAPCLASSLGLNIVKVRASDILDQWLGGSEAAIRSVFSRARAAAPCILFFDEIDALASNRSDGDEDSTNVHSRILSTFLNEMDGVSSSTSTNAPSILVVAATNRLSSLDTALLRPGRYVAPISGQDSP